MVETQVDLARGSVRLVLRPNRSWTWQANLYLLYSLALISGTVAVVMLLLGYWLILPFTIVELGIVLGCLWYCVRQTHRQEVLTLSRDEVHLVQGHRQPEQQYHWQRFHTRVMVEPPERAWSSPRVHLRSQQDNVEIGSFLNAADKITLIADLRRQVRWLSELPPAG